MKSPDTKPTAVIFDWDNTLVDTWPAIHDANNYTMVKMGFEAWTLEETKERVRKSLRESFPEKYGDRWQEAADIFYARFEESHIEQLKPLAGAESLLKTFSNAGVLLAVVSNKTGKYLREEVEHLGWGKYFHKVLGAGDASHDKPHPAPIDLALQDTSIPKNRNIWFVGDTDIDLECAKNSNLSGILIRNRPPEQTEFDAHPPSWYFSSCEEFSDAFSKGDIWEMELT